jgi:V/A-type H+-transporting ATPase subunit A
MGEVLEINGPIVSIRLPSVLNGEQVRLGRLGLIGEVIAREGDQALVQVYESTEGMAPGERVEALGHPLSVELGPGLLGQIVDGVQRPLHALQAESGDYMARGIQVPALDRDTLWPFLPCETLAPGGSLSGGQILGSVQETPSILHRILVPPGFEGELLELAPPGNYRLEQAVGRARTRDGDTVKLFLYQRWPVRLPRPYGKRNDAARPLMTGQRILDTFFPLLKGGKGSVPGPFGAGKTILQHQIARWSNADIVIYVGCGERGNELVDILDSFPRLTDPYSKRPLMERTLLVANTSNMPVVAREASIYVGVTIAEYYRDQGYDVLMVADSTSRWAEALREVSGRLGQMPVEEGYPAYLASRIAAFYERAGRVETLAGNTGSVTLIGAVSPPGGDFSEPVTSHTKENVQVFWALSKELADARHYPAVDWNESFSGYVTEAARWWAQEVDAGWEAARSKAMALLAEDRELSRIVNLVGPEALSSAQRWTLQAATLIREGLLQQNALDPVDSFCSPQKQYALLALMLEIHREGKRLLARGVPVQRLLAMPLLARALRLKHTYSSDQVAELLEFGNEIRGALAPLHAEYGHPAEDPP